MPAGRKRDRRSASTSSGTGSGSGSSTGSGSSSSGSDSESEDDKRKRNPDKKRKPRSPGSPGARPSRGSARNTSERGRRSSSPTPPRDERRGERGSGGGAATTSAAEPPAALSVPSKFEQAEAMKKAGGRTGGIYVPPFKLAALQKEMSKMDKSSKEYQRLKWEQLRKGINGLVNKINVGNLKELVPELFELNLVRGRGLLARSIMKAQLASPG